MSEDAEFAEKVKAMVMQKIKPEALPVDPGEEPLPVVEPVAVDFDTKEVIQEEITEASEEDGSEETVAASTTKKGRKKKSS